MRLSLSPSSSLSVTHTYTYTCTRTQGYVAKILVEDGTNDVPVGDIVIVICEEAADVAAFKDFKAST